MEVEGNEMRESVAVPSGLGIWVGLDKQLLT